MKDVLYHIPLQTAESYLLNDPSQYIFSEILVSSPYKNSPFSIYEVPRYKSKLNRSGPEEIRNVHCLGKDDDYCATHRQSDRAWID